MASSHGQKKLAPRLTQKGFEKRKIPKDIYAAILSNRKKLLSSGKKWNIEYCTLGESFRYTKQNFYLFHITVSRLGIKCHMLFFFHLVVRSRVWLAVLLTKKEAEKKHDTNLPTH